MKYYKKKKIIFRFDIGNLDGFGHYKRSIAFIDFLVRKKFSITICTNRYSLKFLNEKFKKRFLSKRIKKMKKNFF